MNDDKRKPKTIGNSAVSMLLDVPLELTVELGSTRMLIQDVIALGTGSIVELDRLSGEPLDVKVNGKLVARGEAVVINGKLGVRITEIAPGVESDVDAWTRQSGRKGGRAG